MKLAPALIGCKLLGLTWTAPAHADRRFQATLTGAQQVPTVASTATGTGYVVLNTAETQITVDMTFAGLTSNANAAHIHGAAAAGSNAGVLFDAVPTYSTDPAITAMTTKVKALHISELRMAVRLVE